VRLQYFVPGPMSKGPLGPRELTRRQARLCQWVEPATQVVVQDAPDGPLFVESTEHSAAADAIVLNGVRAAERAGYDAFIIGCFGDPGIAAARQQQRISVVGPGQASMRQASRIGRFSIITLLDETIPLHEFQVREAGRTDELASIRPTGIRVLDLPKDPHFTAQRIIEVGRQAVRQDGASVLVLGCMSMSFMGLDDQLTGEIGIPVINPAKAALAALKILSPAVASGDAVGPAYNLDDRTGTQHLGTVQ